MPEQQNIEYKSSWHDDYLKWVCGFANAQGGRIYIGKDDAATIVGLPDYKKLMEDIPNKIKNLMGITAEVNLLQENDKYYQAGQTWDNVIEPRATFDDIDEATVKKYLRKADETGRLPDIDGLSTPELFFIALIHRNYMGAPTQLRVYDNKLTLWNHGTLPDGITLDKLTKHHSSFPRNPILAEACFRGGYIDSWGSGIMKIMDSCKAAGLPTPMIEEDCGGLIVRLFKDRFSEEQLKELGLNDRQVDAILFYKDKKEITGLEYAERYKIAERTARADLADLVEKKLLYKSGETKSVKYLFDIAE